jgi:hypothetical protein
MVKPDPSITVSAYAGYKNPESPRSFIYKGRTVRVSSIVSRNLEEPGNKEGSRKVHFIVTDDHDQQYHIYYMPDDDTWYLKDNQ